MSRLRNVKVSLATRIFLGYSAVLVTFAAVSLFGVSAMHENQTELRLISQGYLPLSQDAAALEALHLQQRRDIDRLVDEKNPETRRALIRLSRLYTPGALLQRLFIAEDSVIRLGRTANSSARNAALLQELQTRLNGLGQRTQKTSQLLERLYKQLETVTPPDELARTLAEVRTQDDGTSHDFRALRAALDSHIRALAQEAEWRERRTGIAIIALSVVAIAVGVLATLFSARTLAPIRTLTQAAARIAQGDFSAQLGLTGEDEVSQLARSFDAMARSLTERQAQLVEKQEALLKVQQLAAAGRVSAQIAHEVRNPLSSIGLNVELLQESLQRVQFTDPVEAQEVRSILSAVLKEVDRVTEVTEGYLEMARLPQPALTPEDVNEVLVSVLDFSREELTRSRVEVDRQLDPEGSWALADEGQLRQVFLNLVRNSREAMHGGGRLTIRSRVDDGQVEVVFADTGGGIPAEASAHIFEPFFSTKKNGTGLGLSVSEQIVKAHGGSIRCDSQPGVGTTFTLRFPRAAS